MLNVIHHEILALRPFSVKARHHLHRIPEASGQEFKTSAWCQSVLRDAGLKITTWPCCTGFIADLQVNDELPLIAFRADMDGLEMQDKTDCEYTSVHPGMAHNCGHDSHMAILLTTAVYLSQHPETLTANVRFIFQMAEEDMTVPGAELMVSLGCMDGVEAVYALHNDASMETGTVKFNDGIMSSWGSAWTLDVQGVSAHGSTPEKGLDAIREVSRIISDMDYIIAKKTSPFSPAVFGCGMMSGGTIPNAVPANATARGTIRAMEEQTDTVLKDSFTSLVAQSELRGFSTSMTYSGYPAVVNHPHAYAALLKAMSFLPESGVDAKGKPMSGSEDFSYMINAVAERKGAMFFLGSGSREKGIQNYLHASPYYLDDDCLMVGCQIFVNLAT